MERKNIFRGKNKKNGWIYGDLIHYRGEVFIAPLGIANPFATAEDFIVDENSVGYFTSLKDKTNKDIYEGDIVERYDYRQDWETGEIEFILEQFVVTFEEGNFCIYEIIQDSKELANLLGVKVSELSEEELEYVGLKVIGNKYDNPELVEE